MAAANTKQAAAGQGGAAKNAGRGGAAADRPAGQPPWRGADR